MNTGNYLSAAVLGLAVALASGCAGIAKESRARTEALKAFPPPSRGMSGLYIYRDSRVGSLLKKDVWVDGRCVGETVPKVFFYREVAGGREHTIATESQISTNTLVLRTEPGKHYFIRQFIKRGLGFGGAGVELVDEEKGKEAVRELDLLVGGRCSGL